MLWLKFILGVNKKARVLGHKVMYDNEFEKKMIKLNHNVDKLTMYICVYLIYAKHGVFFDFFFFRKLTSWHVTFCYDC